MASPEICGKKKSKGRKISRMTRKELFGISMVGALAVTGSFSCFSVFADSLVDISIVEMVDDGAGGYKPWEDIVGAMPGEVYSAIPRVRNDGSLPASVKICLAESGIDAMGNEIELDDGTFAIDINDELWTKESGEGTGGSVTSPIMACYKYNAELAVGAMTEPLFYEVSLSGGLGNEHKNNMFSLHLSAEAVGGEAPTPDEPTPAEPDTGFNTVSYFDIVSPVVFSAGGIIVFAAVTCAIRYIYKKD